MPEEHSQKWIQVCLQHQYMLYIYELPVTEVTAAWAHLLHLYISKHAACISTSKPMWTV